VVSEDNENITAKPNMLYRWNPIKDVVESHATSQKFFEKLSNHTGMNQSEINKEIKSKKSILNWLVKKNVRDIFNVGKVMQEYYLDPEFILKIATKGDDVKKIAPAESKHKKKTKK